MFRDGMSVIVAPVVHSPREIIFHLNDRSLMYVRQQSPICVIVIIIRGGLLPSPDRQDKDEANFINYANN